jgi:hypothetical protein
MRRAGGLVLQVLVPYPLHAQTLEGEKVVVVEPEQLRRFWAEQAPIAVPLYPIAMARMSRSGCFNVGFIIEPDGTVGRLRVLKRHLDNPARGLILKRHLDVPADSVAQKALDAAAAQWVSRLRFVPGVESVNGRPVFTRKPVVVFAADGKQFDPARRKTLAAKCHAGTLQEALAGASPKTEFDEEFIEITFSRIRH